MVEKIKPVVMEKFEFEHRFIQHNITEVFSHYQDCDGRNKKQLLYVQKLYQNRKI